jgi:aspartate/methionine/tyrosine aminotransferase
VNAPDDDGWAFTRAIAEAAGALVSPGDFYGAPDHVRIALVQPDDRIELVAQRLSR